MVENKEPEIIENGTTKKLNKCGLFSFIFSLVGIIIAGLPSGTIAIITGILGIVTFKPDVQKGKWMGITGLVIGVLDVVIVIAFLVLRVAINLNAQ